MVMDEALTGWQGSSGLSSSALPQTALIDCTAQARGRDCRRNCCVDALKLLQRAPASSERRPSSRLLPLESRQYIHTRSILLPGQVEGAGAQVT